MLHLLALTCRIWNLEWLEFFGTGWCWLIWKCDACARLWNGQRKQCESFTIYNEQWKKLSVFTTCLNLTCVISSQTKVNLTKALCNANVGQGYNRISGWRVIIFQPSKNKHLDTVKPRIDCGFGEGNIVAHVALPKAEAYQCFYT